MNDVNTPIARSFIDWFLPFVYSIGFPGFRTSALAWMFLAGLMALEQGMLKTGGVEEQEGRGRRDAA